MRYEAILQGDSENTKAKSVTRSYSTMRQRLQSGTASWLPGEGVVRAKRKPTF
ncbi:hypothetical protein SAMN05443574_106152 [Haloarcula vallismortis]|uniref:Uncharacterized protein n=2 Tax=Haloarcula vallismortis TaxID=28442 RepID=A0A1H2W3B0_HALVA|nr:hypothetical protein SAMN05443574_106152 [Haloarcula vallismortis]